MVRKTNAVKRMKLAMAIVETVLAIPVLGATIIISLLWIPLVIALAGHIVTLVLCKNQKVKSTGSIIGVVANAVGWIPVVGMILHIIAAVVLWNEALKK